MCTLYGLRASAATRIDCSVIRSYHAFQSQREAGSRGRGPGRGVALYVAGVLTTVRHAFGAPDALPLGKPVGQSSVETAVLHGRSATTGAVSISATPPFVYRQWSFAHRGIVTAFDRMAPQLTKETHPLFLAKKRGTMDSELVLLWLLSRMARFGIDPEAQCTDLDGLTRIFASSIRYLSALSHYHGAASPAKLGFLLTDGNVMLASRWNTALYWTERNRMDDCSTCGLPHLRPGGAINEYRAVVLASQPISKERWREVPDASILAIDRDLTVHIQPVQPV